MFRSRRRKPKHPAERASGRRTAEDRFREVEEPDAGDPSDEEDEGQDFTQEFGSDFGSGFGWDADPFAPVAASRYDDDEEEEDGDEEDWREDEFTQTGADAPPELAVTRAAMPEAGPADRVVVSTLLSKKPGKGAALAVGWTLGVIALVSALYWWGPPGFAAALPASGETVFGLGELWRLFTAMAAHADAIHLLSNAVFLSWLIYLSYGAFGSSLYPWSAVPIAALSLAVTLEGYPPNIRVVGASGLLYLLAGSWLTLYVLVERRLSVVKRIVRVVGFFLVVLVPTSIRPEVSYRAHAIGLFFGICLGLAYFLARRNAIRHAERWEWQER